jgi:hypothetical protein
MGDGTPVGKTNPSRYLDSNRTGKCFFYAPRTRDKYKSEWCLDRDFLCLARSIPRPGDLVVVRAPGIRACGRGRVRCPRITGRYGGRMVRICAQRGSADHTSSGVIFLGLGRMAAEACSNTRVAAVVVRDLRPIKRASGLSSRAPRHIDCEDASNARNITHAQYTTVRFNAAS